jgi:hypothetical protein
MTYVRKKMLATDKIRRRWIRYNRSKRLVRMMWAVNGLRLRYACILEIEDLAYVKHLYVVIIYS